MSENRNNNKNSVREYDELIGVGMEKVNTMKELCGRNCNHKKCSQGNLIRLHDSSIDIPGKKYLPESTVICTRCEKYFESEAYDYDHLLEIVVDLLMYAHHDSKNDDTRRTFIVNTIVFMEFANRYMAFVNGMSKYVTDPQSLPNIHGLMTLFRTSSKLYDITKDRFDEIFYVMESMVEQVKLNTSDDLSIIRMEADNIYNIIENLRSVIREELK